MKSILSIFLFLTILLLPRYSDAATIRIDSLEVQEDSNYLVLHGLFGTTPRAVTVGGLKATPNSWSNSIVVVTIPGTGPGSAGEIVVESTGKSADTAMLSVITCRQYYMERFTDTGLDESSTSELSAVIRIDPRSLRIDRPGLHLSLNEASTLKLSSQMRNMHPYPGVSNYSYAGSKTFTHRGPKPEFDLDLDYSAARRELYISVSQDITFTTEGRGSFYFKPGDTTITETCRLNCSSFSFELDSAYDVDSLYGIHPVDNNFIYGNGWDTTKGGSSEYIPKGLISLGNIPRILSIDYDHRDSIGFFSWNSITGIDRYELQIAADSAFKEIVTQFGSPDSSCATQLLPSGKYYCRVRGVNRYGNSAWSAIRPFSTGLSGVRREDTQPSVMLQQMGGYLHYQSTSPHSVLCICDVLGRVQITYPVVADGEEHSIRLDVKSFGYAMLRDGAQIICVRRLARVANE